MVMRLGALALFLVARNLPAAALWDVPVIAQFGNWSVHRGAGVCGATYGKDPGVEIRPGALFIARKGGLQSIQIRFDSEPFGSVRSLSDEERTAAAARITGAEFERLSSGVTRLRVKLESLTRGRWDADIDLRGAREAIAEIKTTCP